MEADINEVFDSIAFSEETVCQNGFEEGLKKGNDSGMKEGYHYGYHRGIELGREIGFYEGFVDEMLKQHERKEPGKIKGLLLKFQTSLKEIPHENHEGVDFEEQILSFRSLYKTICSLAGLSTALPINSSSLKY